MERIINLLTSTGGEVLGPAWPIAWILIKIVAVTLPLMGCVAYLTLWSAR